MIEKIMQEFQYMDNGTTQGMVFAIGIAAYYLFRKLFSKN